MPSYTEDGLSDEGAPERPFRFPDLSASGERAPPTPAQIFVSLAILIVISLGFGLAAQFLVG